MPNQLRGKWNWLGHTEKKHALPNVYCSGNHYATEEESDQRTPGQRDLEIEMYTTGFRYAWRNTKVVAQDIVGPVMCLY